MKRKLILGMLLAASVCFSACGGGEAVPAASDQAGQEAEVREISAAVAYERMHSGDPVVILDVRTPEEYEAAHIPGAILLPNEEIGADQPELLPDLDAEILIYCRSGNRSAQAAAKLLALGYTQLYDFGGVNDWPYETEAGAWPASGGGEGGV